ncbi:hypothetical protein LCGC14_2007050 [marine sediment metagenome]|uniref:DUF2442 domain-containing protein n=1 Tax=marine sediment metagenome TaxID=412755 RepID=A0A0F9F1I6_9ZZZZ
MSTSAHKTTEPFADSIWFDADMLHVRLLDGREVSVPLEWFPRLRDADEGQRKNWRLIGRGIGIQKGPQGGTLVGGYTFQELRAIAARQV